MKLYHVYVMTNKPRGVLYIGVTGNLARRVMEHKEQKIPGFTKLYNLTMLAYAEEFQYIDFAIQREKQIKNWHQDWKINLIESANPHWQDWFERING